MTAPVPWRAQADEMREASRGTREIDHHVGGLRRCAGVGADRHAGRPAEALAGVTSDDGASRDVEGRDQRAAGIREDRLDQRLAHLSAGARDGDAHRRHFFLKMSRNCSHHERGSDQAPSPAVMACADLLSSATEIGISSPSQRASLSSTK